MRWIPVALLAALVAGCSESGDPPKPPPPREEPVEKPADKPAEKTEEPAAKPGAEPAASTGAKFMRSNEKQFKLALAEAGKPDKVDSVKARLKTIRGNLEAFKKGWTPKGHDPKATPEDDAATAEIMLDLFFHTLGQVEAGDLGGEGGHDSVERLRLRCDACHEKFRDSE